MIPIRESKPSRIPEIDNAIKLRNGVERVVISVGKKHREIAQSIQKEILQMVVFLEGSLAEQSQKVKMKRKGGLTLSRLKAKSRNLLNPTSLLSKFSKKKRACIPNSWIVSALLKVISTRFKLEL